MQFLPASRSPALALKSPRRRGHARRTAPGREAGAGARRAMSRLTPLWRRAAGLGLDGMVVAGGLPVAGVIAGAVGLELAGGTRDPAPRARNCRAMAWS